MWAVEPALSPVAQGTISEWVTALPESHRRKVTAVQISSQRTENLYCQWTSVCATDVCIQKKASPPLHAKMTVSILNMNKQSAAVSTSLQRHCSLLIGASCPRVFPLPVDSHGLTTNITLRYFFNCFSSFWASASAPQVRGRLLSHFYPSVLIAVASVHVSAGMLTHSAPQEDENPDG